MLKLRCCFPQP